MLSLVNNNDFFLPKFIVCFFVSWSRMAIALWRISSLSSTSIWYYWHTLIRLLRHCSCAARELFRFARRVLIWLLAFLSWAKFWSFISRRNRKAVLFEIWCFALLVEFGLWDWTVRGCWRNYWCLRELFSVPREELLSLKLSAAYRSSKLLIYSMLASESSSSLNRVIVCTFLPVVSSIVLPL